MHASLQTRNSTVGAKWEQQYFKLDDGVLESFSMAPGHKDEPINRIPLRRITGLELELRKKECSFFAEGVKVRLRSSTEKEIRNWYEALLRVQQDHHEMEPPETLVHISSLHGLPSSDSGVHTESKWYAVVHWQHHTCRYWTREKETTPGAIPGTDDCQLKQTLRLETIPEESRLVVELYRVATGIGGDHRHGECVLDVRNCAQTRDQPLLFSDGHPTGTTIRLRVQDGHDSTPDDHFPPAPSPRPCPAGPARAPTASRLVDDRLSATPSSPSRPSPFSQSPSPHKAGMAFRGVSKAVRPLVSTARGVRPVPNTETSGILMADISDEAPLSARGSRRERPATAEPPRQAWTDSLVLTPSSRAASQTPEPQRATRRQQLHELHAVKQKRLEAQRQEEEEQDRRRRQEDYEASLKKTRSNWSHSDLDPHKAADRLYADSRARSRELVRRQQRYEEEERQEVEDRRFRKNNNNKPLARSESAPSHVRAKESGERLYKDQQKRVEQVQKRREEREARIQQELEKSSAGPYRRCLTARGETKRHEELYGYAAIQREVLRRKRQEREDAEKRKFDKALLETRSGPHDPKRIDDLFRDHQEREKKRAFKKAEQQNKELLRLEEDAKMRRANRPLPPSAECLEQVSVTLELSDVDGGMLLSDHGLLEQFQAAVAAVVAAEAGGGISPDQVEVEFTEGPNSENSVVAHATLMLTGSAAAAAHAALNAAGANGSLGVKVIESLAGLEDVGSVSQGEISMGDSGAAVQLVMAEGKRGRDVPIWQRSLVPNRKDEPQESTPAAAADMATSADIVLNVIVSSISSRCYGDRTSTVAELKWLGAPLKAAMGVIKDSVGVSEKGEGFLKLCSMPSQRIFLDGQLVPEDEGWKLCIEPSPIRQVEDCLDDLMDTAEEVQAKLGELLAPTAAPDAVWEPGTSRSKPSGVPSAVLAYNPGIKPRERAELKALVRYQVSDRGRSARHLLDLARYGLVFANSQMLLKGLETIVKKFEVLTICNRYNIPDRLGNRFVEVQLCLEVMRGETRVPHVCELRLEELVFESSRNTAAPHLQQFFQRVTSVYDNQTRDPASVAYLAHSLLVDPPESHGLRVLRRKLAKSYGSTVSAWRRSFGLVRQLNYLRFRDLCHALCCRKESPEHWSRLDPGMSGCISIFDLDPDAVALLVHIRSRLLTISNADDADPDGLFRKLTYHMVLSKPGQLDIAEFRQVLKGFGFDVPVADRAFTCLDLEGGAHRPPASVSAADFAFLQRLPQLVDVDAVMLQSRAKLSDLESLRHLVTHKGSPIGRGPPTRHMHAASADAEACRSTPRTERGRSRERTDMGGPIYKK